MWCHCSGVYGTWTNVYRQLINFSDLNVVMEYQPIGGVISRTKDKVKTHKRMTQNPSNNSTTRKINNSKHKGRMKFAFNIMSRGFQNANSAITDK